MGIFSRQTRVPREPRNGVSSFHAWWRGIDSADPFVQAAATLEVITAPTADRLYFWALQVTFHDGHREHGGAHVGLQWNPRHAGNTAVNWGGYGVVSDVTSILPGTASALASTVDDVNTRDFAWRAGTPYRFVVHRVADGWAADVTDTGTGKTSRIRTLHCGGDRLTNPVVWSEVFAGCLDPSAVIVWSNLELVTRMGRTIRPTSVSLTFPADGACPNTDTSGGNGVVVQTTNTARRGHDGQIISLR